MGTSTFLCKGIIYLRRAFFSRARLIPPFSLPGGSVCGAAHNRFLPRPGPTRENRRSAGNALSKCKKKPKIAASELDFRQRRDILASIPIEMVVVAQLVRAPGCGPGGRGFESRLPPHYKFSVRVSPLIRAFLFSA